MPLQTSGQISISQIRAELGSASGSLRTLSSLAGFSTPDAMSEFYGYPPTQPTVSWGTVNPSVNPWVVTYDAPEASASAYVDSIIANASGPVTERIITLSYNGNNYRYFSLDGESGYGYTTNWSRLIPDSTQGATAKVNFRYTADFGAFNRGLLTILIYPPTGRTFANISESGSGYRSSPSYTQISTSTQIRRYVESSIQDYSTTGTYTFNIFFDLV